MKFLFLFFVLIFSFAASAQKERDTVMNRCPVFITDSVSSNNFFLEHQPSTIKVYRTHGDLTIIIEQREQFFTLFFGVKNLDDKKYKITGSPGSKKDVLAKYSFRLGEQVSYVNMTSGTVETSFNKETKLWNIKVNGLLANFVGQSVTFFKVKADFSIP
jgi:hypothetical protein